MTVNFDLTDYNPSKTAAGKQWLKDNPDKTFIFKADGKKGYWQWNVEKKADGKRYLTTKNVTVGRDSNLTALQKKLPAPKVDGKLTGKSVQPFVRPEDVPVTNMVSPTFQSFLKKYRDKIISDIALALCEVVDMRVKKESRTERSNKYFIDYDSNGRRINEGYIVESDEKKENINWNTKEVQDAIIKAIPGIKIDTGKTTDKELIFTHNGKNGSMHLQGYMLVLDTDTDDEIPPTNYPVKDKNNLTIENLLDTVKTVFSRRESLNKVTENYSSFGMKEQSEELDGTLPDPRYYILIGTLDSSVGIMDPEWDEIVGEEEGYLKKTDAINNARSLFRSRESKGFPYAPFAVTDRVSILDFLHDNFWDSLDNGNIKLVWDSESDDSLHDYAMDSFEECYKKESVEDHMEFHSSPVFSEVAKERLLDSLGCSLIPAPVPTYNGVLQESRIPNTQLIWFYLSPSYAVQQLSDIVIPVWLHDNKVSMPMVDMPDPEVVFDGNYTENAMSDYNDSVQDYIMKDAPMSDIMELDLDNADDVKTRVVDVINTMAENYQQNRNKLENLLEYKGESLLREARYYIIKKDSNPKTMEEVTKITPTGFMDVNMAKDSISDLTDSGKYDFALAVLDVNNTKDNTQWKEIA